ncbi:MAG: UDP-N-acetylmuramate dehydrogenase [Candidatus Vogelbacteria bacterium]
MMRLKQNVLLAPYTTFGIGGRARYFISATNPAELVSAVRLAKKNHWRYFIIAGGSNVVFGDKTFDGLVIRFLPSPSGRVERGQGSTLTCPANLSLECLIKTAISNGLAGLETLSGIPGTVGGAIVGNAGAYGQTISDCLVKVEIFDGRKIKWLTKKQCRFTYRDSIFKHRGWIILRAEFKLVKGVKKDLAKKSQEIIKIRIEKYDPKLRCPGSFFKNVLVEDISSQTKKLIDQTKIRDDKIPAGYLLEAVGAKGMRVGGIYVAGWHGNLLINDGHGTYHDVKTLVAKLKRLVKNKFGITLDEEVRYMIA